MLRKHQQILILLVGLLYVHSVCPFLCATLEQKSCHSGLQKILGGDTEARSTCCQSTRADAMSETGTPSESGESCCSKGLELVLPNDKHNTPELRELIEQSLISILPMPAVLPIAAQESFQTVLTPLISTLFPDHPLSHRGPPPVQC